MKQLSVLVFILNVLSLNAQNTSVYPDNFSLYHKTQTWINPSTIILDSTTTHVSIRNKTKTNTLGNVGTYQLEGGFTVKKVRYVRQLKVLMANEKEGPYIRRPSVYVNYALKIPLNLYSYLSMGTNIGFSSSFVDNATNSSYLAPDGSIGLTLYYKDWLLGVSGMQILNNVLTEDQFSPKLSRYYHVQSSYSFRINQNYHLRLDGLYSHYIDMPNHLNGGLAFEKQNHFAIGTMFQNIKGMMVWANYRLRIQDKYFDLSMAYNTGAFSVSQRTNQDVELILKFLFE